MTLIYALCLLFISPTLVNAGFLNVSIYYEALCPDSIKFITNQFYPTYKNLETFLNIDLVPFGKAEAYISHGDWKFNCQHGPKECYGNKIQACVINLYSNGPISVRFVNCAMNSPDPSSDLYLKQCAETFQIPWNSIVDCYTSEKADILLVANGVKTHTVSPPINFIPTITFNNINDVDIQQDVLTHFQYVVCKLLKNKPKICKF